jgi:hypothetical protein
MAIRQSVLREYSRRVVTAKTETITEAKRSGIKTAFLCHSHLDGTLVDGLVKLFNSEGWNIYVDWKDTTLPSKPDRNTAIAIQGKIRSSTYFIYLATKNSMNSTWCPWEIGYADGEKPIDSIFVVSTTEDSTTYGNEYLDLYRHIDFSEKNRLATWRPNETKGPALSSL